MNEPSSFGIHPSYAGDTLCPFEYVNLVWANEKGPEHKKQEKDSTRTEGAKNDFVSLVFFLAPFVEIMHADICKVLDPFEPFKTKCPIAEATEHTLQLPVYASLTEKDLDRMLKVIRAATGPSSQLLTGTAQRYN